MRVWVFFNNFSNKKLTCWKSLSPLISVEIRYVSMSVELSHNGCAANKTVSSVKKIVLFCRGLNDKRNCIIKKNLRTINKISSITLFWSWNTSWREFLNILDKHDKPERIFLCFFVEKNELFWAYYSSLPDWIQNHKCTTCIREYFFSSVILVKTGELYH